MFVDAFNARHGKVEREMYYHLLIGFDPEGEYSADYWLEHLYRACRTQDRPTANGTLRGITAAPEEIAAVLEEANALIIPAHLHTQHD